MGTDFFDDLGETLSRTAREFGERAESLYETQKLRGKISVEERAVTKLMADLGRTLYRTYMKGEELTEEQMSLCSQIDRHKDVISRYKAEMAGKKGKKICPCCGESVDQYAAFCPYCGAACPVPEKKEKTGKTADSAEQTAEEPEDPAEESAEDSSVERTAEKPEDSPAEESAEEPEGSPVEESGEGSENSPAEESAEMDPEKPE